MARSSGASSSPAGHPRQLHNRDTRAIVLFAAALALLGIFTLVGPGNDPLKWILGVLGLAAGIYLVRYGMPSRAEIGRNQVTFHFPTRRVVTLTAADLVTARVQARTLARSVSLRRQGDIGFSLKLSGWDEPALLAEALAGIVRSANGLPEQQRRETLLELSRQVREERHPGQ